MYENHFGIKRKPFSIAPDPGFLYMSNGHREALAHLRYGLESDGGFVLLTGEVGTGKTTVCRCLLEQVPNDADIAYILNPKVTVVELLETICDELRIDRPTTSISVKNLVDRINAYLLKAHAARRRTVLIIDEAQNLGADVLEQIRLLTNLETNQQKLLQIILLGQPELQDKLASKELYQLSQRISARHHLGPLSKKETKSYVLHRLSVAGLNRQVFLEESYQKLYQLSGGIPRLINVIGDRALLGAFAKERRQVDQKTVEKAAKEVFGERVRKNHFSSIPPWQIAGATAIVAAILLVVIFSQPGAWQGDKRVEAGEVGKEIIPAPTNEGDGEQPAQPSTEKSPSVTAITVPKPRWPEGRDAAQSEELSFQNLFALWDLEYNPAGQWPCQFAEERGLYCLSQQSSIESLIRLNRPAVLLMLNSKGEEFHASLSKVEGPVASFHIGPKTYKVMLDDIAPYWTGRSIILWRPPPAYQGSIRPGKKGADVEWLADKMAIISGEEYDDKVSTHLYNEPLVKKIKVFQFENGLVSDGIAGKETLIMVNSRATHDVPLLHN